MTMNVVTPARSSVARSVWRWVKPNHCSREPAGMRAAAVYHRRALGRNDLERAQEVQQILLGRFGQRVETIDHGVGLGGLELRVARALVGADGREQVGRAPVMQEKDPLAKTPQRGRAELVTGRGALRDLVGQAGP